MIKIYFYISLFFLSLSSFAQTAEELNKQSESIINENPDEALQLSKKAIDKAKTEKNKLQEGFGYLNLGTALYYLDEYDNGVIEIKKGLAIAIETNDKNLEGKCECIIGEIYVYTAEYEKSLEHLSKARNIFEENNKKKEE